MPISQASMVLQTFWSQRICTRTPRCLSTSAAVSPSSCVRTKTAMSPGSTPRSRLPSFSATAKDASSSAQGTRSSPRRPASIIAVIRSVNTMPCCCRRSAAVCAGVSCQLLTHSNGTASMMAPSGRFCMSGRFFGDDFTSR